MRIAADKLAVAEARRKLTNWGKWGADDQTGTLNHIRPEDIVRAAGLVRTGKVFGLGIPLDRDGPQTGLSGARWNPIATMLATGPDLVAGHHDEKPGLHHSGDALHIAVHSGTQWVSLGHIFYDGQLYNGHDARLADSPSPIKLGIEHSKSKMAGRGVLLDVARFKGVDYLEDGYGISNDDLNTCARAQNVEVRRGDFVIIRTGQMERCLKLRNWGTYAGGPAPGVKFENCYWCHDREVAAICSDTWGVEVRPNESREVDQPWHLVVIPAMGLTMGEMFHLKDLADDCLSDGIYEFFFCGPPLVITGGTGSPINPLAIK